VPATLSALKVFISTLLDKVPSQTNIEYSFVCCYMQKFLYTLGQYEVVSVIFYTVDNERSSTLQNEASAKSALADATSVAEKSHSSFDQHAHELAESKTVAIDEANKLLIWVEKHGQVLEAVRNNSITGVESCLQLNCKDNALSLISAVVVSGVPLTVVPEPTRAQCHELDMEISQLISELHSGVSSALESLGEYSLVLQQVLPVNYIATSPIASWAQVLQLSVNSASQDVLTLAKRQAAEITSKVKGENMNLVQQRYWDLLNQMESYVTFVERLAKECSEVMSSIGSDSEVQSRERMLSLIRNSVQLPSQIKDEDNIHLSHSGNVGPGEIKGKDDIQSKVLSILWIAVGQLYSDARAKVSDLSTKAIGRAKFRTDDVDRQADAGMSLQLFDQQIEKCALVSGVVDEVHGVIGSKIAERSAAYAKPQPRHWASTFQAALRSSINMIEQMTEIFVPEFIRSFVSCNSEVMEAIGSISQIRGSVDTALEKLVEVELDRTSLTELEQSYFVKVGQITEQQIALEEEAAKGREHLSWEEAEELASQEEVCRAQLEQLQETWSQKDVRISSLTKVEAGIMNMLHSSKQHLSTLLDPDHDSEFHLRRSTALLSCLAKPFVDLESLDNMLSSRGSFPSHMDQPISNLKELLSLGFPLSDVVWPSAGLLKDNAFFVWKVSFLDSVLD
jgi:serine/threonine-protein kinase SMG1